jgi:spermidine synthase
MTQPSSHSPVEPSASPPFLPLLLVLFAGSGCAALIYEIVWLQLLQLVIGSTAVSLGVLLGTFMGGMCLGSLAAPRLLSVRHHPLRVYALLELAIGVLGVALLHALPHVDGVYTTFLGSGLPGILLRGVVCGVCLLPPTVLMGATLPALARWVETTPQGVSWLGFFYGGNIAGAVFGCLLAGFYLLRVYDMATAVYVAATVNVLVAATSFLLSTACASRGTVTPRETPEAACVPHNSWPVYITIALSGASALAAEVIWTRLLSLLLGATVYTFSIILAVFLVGLGIGSSVGALVALAVGRPRLALGVCQWLLAAAIAWTAYAIAVALPFWPINPHLNGSPWIAFQLDLARCFWAILPATCLWGASFPLALAAAATPGQDPGRLVGRVYAANTVGAIFGALGASLFLIAWLGTQDSQRVLIGLSALAALLLLVPFFAPLRRTDSPAGRWLRFRPRPAGVLLLLGAVGLPVALAWSMRPVPWELVAFGRQLMTVEGQWDLLYLGEGRNASVAVTEVDKAVYSFHVSGKVEASTQPTDMRLQRMLGHLPALIHTRPQSVLIVGCGAGVTAGSFVVHPEIEHIVLCEIEPLVPQVVAQYFGDANHHVVDDPRVEIVFDDARHFLLTTRERFDVITSDPIHPWVKGSATLYTTEYFELCKRHLNPGGLITQWVPLYESTAAVVRSELATFFEVFPEGTVWGNDQAGLGYDVVLLGQVEPTKIDADELQGRLDRPDHAAVAKSLNDVSFGGTVGLFKTYAGRASDLKPWLEGAEINRDRNLRLQYLAGLGLNADESTLIYEEMLAYRRFPEDLFVGTGMRSTALRWALTPKSSVAGR